MILQKDLTCLRLKEKIEQLIFSEQKLSQFKENLGKFHYPDAAGEIAKRVIQLARKS